MKDLLDVHTHTLASVHAYSTLREMITAAKEKGLSLVGISDHAPAMPGAFHEFYFCNFKVIRRDAYGIDLLMGVELNILDFSGSTDLRQEYLDRMDYAIASLHNPCIKPGNRAENTAALIGAMQKPKVKIIGHPDNPDYPVDFDALAQAAKEYHVLLECNNSSYTPGGSRQGSRELAGQLLAACQRHNTMVIMGSDAHIDLDVGNHSYAQELISKYAFPEELVINSSPEKFKEWVQG
ncbi:MAG: phosphatase [Selenomonas sp.]|jgi:putative hydrolase|uniref:phosphatase n=1 Tax=Selenomonas sp. AE3005 TaxID=1485543 RepID=UPI000482139B|nr:phosphatase [Selenomonas sp. AE3005]MBQ1460766.1 phosphatase [Selenomonas sp.]